MGELDMKAMLHFLFSVNGRASRSDLWVRYWLPTLVSEFVAWLLDAMLGTDGFEYVLGLAVLASFLAVGARRFHDRNRTGWLILLSFIPLLNLWVILETWFLAGTPGRNDYGPEPLS